MHKCSFCKKDITPGTGVMLVKKDGKTLFFCSSKCERNLLKLKRKPQNQKWAGNKK